MLFEKSLMKKMNRVIECGVIVAFLVGALPTVGSANNNLRVPAAAGDCSNNPDIITLAQEPGAPANQTVCGIKTSDATGADLYQFLGIQYADSTAGNNRWQPPQPPQWTVINASQYGNRCPQGSTWQSSSLPGDVSEDCLFLNVWTPKLTPAADGNLPVMVFIHGGAFLMGSGSGNPGGQNLYDGARFIETSRQGENIVFVTLNYRLGALGFLAGDQLGLDGNFGIQDQQKALQWVQRNISRFGGNPARVLVFGESAGAQSTALHLTMPSSQPLFARAILESNYAISYMGLTEAQKKADRFAFLLGCNQEADVLACLRSRPLDQILDGQMIGAYTLKNLQCAGLQAVIPWNPVIDQKLIKQAPINAVINKPIMLGTNLNESIPFVAPVPPSLYPVLMDALFDPGQALKIMIDYSMEYPGQASQQLQQTVTDYLWTCFNRQFASRSTAGAYRYFYTHHGSFPFWVDGQNQVSGAVPEQCAVDGKVCHADELPFVFGNAVNDKGLAQSFTAEEADLSLALRRYWIQFARSGDPNVAGAPNWPLDATGSLLRMAAPSAAITAVTDQSIAGPAHCADLWDQVTYTVTSAYSCPASD